MIKVVGLIVSLLLVAACGHDPAPVPASDPAMTERYGAPVVASPREMRGVAGDPCRALLSNEALDALEVRQPGRPEVLLTGDHSCAWTRNDGRQRFGITTVVGRDVLVDTYRVRQFAVFSPLVIDGLPATREMTSTESSSCNVTVGTADGQGFIVDYTDPGPIGGGPKDPCGKAQRVAERVVAALPPLAGK